MNKEQFIDFMKDVAHKDTKDENTLIISEGSVLEINYLIPQVEKCVYRLKCGDTAILSDTSCKFNMNAIAGFPELSVEFSYEKMLDTILFTIKNRNIE